MLHLYMITCYMHDYICYMLHDYTCYMIICYMHDYICYMITCYIITHAT